jgi:hypothetical protein
MYYSSYFVEWGKGIERISKKTFLHPSLVQASVTLLNAAFIGDSKVQTGYNTKDNGMI